MTHHLNVSITSTLPSHVAAMSDCLRDKDVAELQAAGLRPGRALWKCYRKSIYSRTAFVDSEPAAMWGLAGSPMGRIGQPWLLTTPAVEKAKIAFVREARHEVAEMLTICPVLQGYVDATYETAVRLLEKLGFEVGPPRPFGACGGMFSHYRIERP